MWKIGLGVTIGFAAGLFVAKLAYESKVRNAIGSGLDAIGSKAGVNLRGGTVEGIADYFAGV